MCVNGCIFMVGLFQGENAPATKIQGLRPQGSRGQTAWPYGANLVSASLPGQGWSILHNSIQSIFQSILKLTGISSEKEAVNFLLDKVGEPYITSYVNHVSSTPNTRRAPHAIVPDLLAHNFPTGRQQVPCFLKLDFLPTALYVGIVHGWSPIKTKTKTPHNHNTPPP